MSEMNRSRIVFIEMMMIKDQNMYEQNKEKNSSHVDVGVDQWYDVVHTTPFETITQRSKH